MTKEELFSLKDGSLITEIDPAYGVTLYLKQGEYLTLLSASEHCFEQYLGVSYHLCRLIYTKYMDVTADFHQHRVQDTSHATTEEPACSCKSYDPWHNPNHEASCPYLRWRSSK